MLESFLLFHCQHRTGDTQFSGYNRHIHFFKPFSIDQFGKVQFEIQLFLRSAVLRSGRDNIDRAIRKSFLKIACHSVQIRAGGYTLYQNVWILFSDPVVIDSSAPTVLGHVLNCR